VHSSKAQKESPKSVASISNRSVRDFSEEEEAYLTTIQPTENDPASFFTWRDENIIQLINIINNPLYDQLLPPFVINMPMTIR
jgi:hypothetical protein